MPRSPRGRDSIPDIVHGVFLASDTFSLWDSCRPRLMRLLIVSPAILFGHSRPDYLDVQANEIDSIPLDSKLS
jgi:hypothetical protein